jgi:hypothetical protein
MRKSRTLKFILLSALSISALTACGGPSVENLEATCESLRSQMTQFEDIAMLDRKLYYDGERAARSLGEDTRAENKRFIYQGFPFMKDYTIEGLQAGEYEKGLKSYQIQTAIHIFSSTPNPIDLTDEEKIAIAASTDPYAEIIEPKVLRVIGENYSDDGCVGLDRANDVDYDFLVNELYTDTQNAAEESVDQLLGILLCERDGKVEDTECEAEDFEFTFSTTPSEPTPEELEILEERRQDAERESQNPSTPSYSSATPFQLCGSLGAVVQTENYGELTCKYALVNRIRALVWMRS